MHLSTHASFCLYIYQSVCPLLRGLLLLLNFLLCIIFIGIIIIIIVPTRLIQTQITQARSSLYQNYNYAINKDPSNNVITRHHTNLVFFAP